MMEVRGFVKKGSFVPTKSRVKTAEQKLRDRRDKRAVKKAEVESARIRAMFDADRERMLRRYTVVSTNAPL
jgi:hypothetical protein